MYVRWEGKRADGEIVSATLPLVIALRGHEPILPGVLDGSVSARIVDELDAK
jgi:hypothetical protein